MAPGRPRVLIVYDDLTDAVSAYFAGTRAVCLRPAPGDRHLLLEVDAEDRVVGVVLHGTSDRVPARWAEHPDRPLLPVELLAELDRWLAHRWADLRIAN